MKLAQKTFHREEYLLLYSQNKLVGIIIIIPTQEKRDGGCVRLNRDIFYTDRSKSSQGPGARIYDVTHPNLI